MAEIQNVIDNAIAATDLANDAAIAANNAALNTILATSAANTAANKANAAVDNLGNIVTDSEQAVIDANTAASNAEAASVLANAAAINADNKANLANTAANSANTAASSANSAATSANTEANKANVATVAANTATTNANTATTNANDAATNANTQATNAYNAASTANAEASNAKVQADNVKAKGDYAQQQGDYAKTQGDYAKLKGDEAIVAKDAANAATATANTAASNADIATNEAEVATDDAIRETHKTIDATTSCIEATNSAINAEINAMNSIRYDISQNLTEAQRAQANSNLGQMGILNTNEFDVFINGPMYGFKYPYIYYKEGLNSNMSLYNIETCKVDYSFSLPNYGNYFWGYGHYANDSIVINDDYSVYITNYPNIVQKISKTGQSLALFDFTKYPNLSASSQRLCKFGNYLYVHFGNAILTLDMDLNEINYTETPMYKMPLNKNRGLKLNNKIGDKELFLTENRVTGELDLVYYNGNITNPFTKVNYTIKDKTVDQKIWAVMPPNTSHPDAWVLLVGKHDRMDSWGSCIYYCYINDVTANNEFSPTGLPVDQIHFIDATTIPFYISSYITYRDVRLEGVYAQYKQKGNYHYPFALHTSKFENTDQNSILLYEDNNVTVSHNYIILNDLFYTSNGEKLKVTIKKAHLSKINSW